MDKPKLSWKEVPGKTESINPFDAVFGGVTYGLVKVLGKAGKVLRLNKTWRPGDKLQILFLAYSGARNTGAEVRVGECIRQVNQILGEDRVEINMSTLDVKAAGEYYAGFHVNLKHFDTVYFRDIYKLVLENHLIVLVEGSCWKENFASALLLYFLYGSGLAAQLGKPCFSYAVEAGKMNKLNNYLSHVLSRDMTRFITRNDDSTRVLEKLGLPGAITRVDTAWTQEAETRDYAVGILKARGWDGKRPLIGLAMQNYDRWPVIPHVGNFVKALVTGEHKNQYKSIYFYDYSKEDEQRYQSWAQMLAGLVDWIAKKYKAQPVLIGMEALDEESCKDVQALMKSKAILISCNEFVGVQIAAILRVLDLLVTTRYHAMVLSLPGKIPFIGLSRDERIRGVMKELGLFDDYYVDRKTDNIEAELRARVERIMNNPAERERIRQVIDEHLPYYYAQMAMLGLDIRQIVRDAFPGFELKPLDENKAMELIPFAPPELIDRVQAKFLELKQA